MEVPLQNSQNADAIYVEYITSDRDPFDIRAYLKDLAAKEPLYRWNNITMGLRPYRQQGNSTLQLRNAVHKQVKQFMVPPFHIFILGTLTCSVLEARAILTSALVTGGFCTPDSLLIELLDDYAGFLLVTVNKMMAQELCELMSERPPIIKQLCGPLFTYRQPSNLTLRPGFLTAQNLSDFAADELPIAQAAARSYRSHISMASVHEDDMSESSYHGHPPPGKASDACLHSFAAGGKNVSPNGPLSSRSLYGSPIAHMTPPPPTTVGAGQTPRGHIPTPTTSQQWPQTRFTTPMATTSNIGRFHMSTHLSAAEHGIDRATVLHRPSSYRAALTRDSGKEPQDDIVSDAVGNATPVTRLDQQMAQAAEPSSASNAPAGTSAPLEDLQMDLVSLPDLTSNPSQFRDPPAVHQEASNTYSVLQMGGHSSSSDTDSTLIDLSPDADMGVRTEDGPVPNSSPDVRMALHQPHLFAGEYEITPPPDGSDENNDTLERRAPSAMALSVGVDRSPILHFLMNLVASQRWTQPTESHYYVHPQTGIRFKPPLPETHLYPYPYLGIPSATPLSHAQMFPYDCSTWALCWLAQLNLADGNNTPEWHHGGLTPDMLKAGGAFLAMRLQEHKDFEPEQSDFIRASLELYKRCYSARIFYPETPAPALENSPSAATLLRLFEPAVTLYAIGDIYQICGGTQGLTLRRLLSLSTSDQYILMFRLPQHVELCSLAVVMDLLRPAFADFVDFMDIDFPPLLETMGTRQYHLPLGSHSGDLPSSSTNSYHLGLASAMDARADSPPAPRTSNSSACVYTSPCVRCRTRRYATAARRISSPTRFLGDNNPSVNWDPGLLVTKETFVSGTWVNVHITRPKLLPETATFPFDCGIRHAIELLRLRQHEGEDLTREQMRPLLLHDLRNLYDFIDDRSGSHYSEIPPGSLDSSHVCRLHALVKQYVQFFTMSPSTRWIANPPTLESSITIRTLIALFQLPYFLFQWFDSPAEIIAVTDGLTIPHIMSAETLAVGHTFLFHDNHVRLVDMQCVREVLYTHRKAQPFFEYPLKTISLLFLDDWRPIGAYSTTGRPTSRDKPPHRLGGTAGRPSPYRPSRTLDWWYPTTAVAAPSLPSPSSPPSSPLSSIYARGDYAPRPTTPEIFYLPRQTVTPEQPSSASEYTLPQDRLGWDSTPSEPMAAYFQLQVTADQSAQLLLFVPDLLPEISTLPFDCGPWHAANLIHLKTMEGAGHWTARPLAITDLELIQQYATFRARRGRSSLTAAQFSHLTNILENYTTHLQPDPGIVPPTLSLDSSWTVQLLIDLFQLSFVLIEHADDCYEVVATTEFDVPINSLGAHNLPLSLSGSHTLVFKTHHVRLINWRTHCPAIARLDVGECWRNIRRLSQLDIATARPVGSQPHAAHTRDLPSTSHPTVLPAASTPDDSDRSHIENLSDPSDRLPTGLGVNTVDSGDPLLAELLTTIDHVGASVPPDSYGTAARLDSTFSWIGLHPHIYGLHCMHIPNSQTSHLNALLDATEITEPLLLDTLDQISPIVMILRGSCEQTPLSSDSPFLSFLSLLYLLHMRLDDPLYELDLWTAGRPLPYEEMGRHILPWLENHSNLVASHPQVTCLVRLLRQGPHHWYIPNPVDPLTAGLLLQQLNPCMRYWHQTDSGLWAMRSWTNPYDLPHNTGTDFVSDGNWLDIGNLAGDDSYCILHPPPMYGTRFWTQVVMAALQDPSPPSQDPTVSDIPPASCESPAATTHRPRLTPVVAQLPSHVRSQLHSQFPDNSAGTLTSYLPALPASYPSDVEPFSSMARTPGLLHLSSNGVEARLPFNTPIILFHPQAVYAALYLLHYLEQRQYGIQYATQLPRRIPLAGSLSRWLQQLIDHTSTDSWLTDKLARLQLQLHLGLLPPVQDHLQPAEVHVLSTLLCCPYRLWHQTVHGGWTLVDPAHPQDSSHICAISELQAPDGTDIGLTRAGVYCLLPTPAHLQFPPTCHPQLKPPLRWTSPSTDTLPELLVVPDVSQLHIHSETGTQGTEQPLPDRPVEFLADPISPSLSGTNLLAQPPDPYRAHLAPTDLSRHLTGLPLLPLPADNIGSQPLFFPLFQASQMLHPTTLIPPSELPRHTWELSLGARTGTGIGRPTLWVTAIWYNPHITEEGQLIVETQATPERRRSKRHTRPTRLGPAYAPSCLDSYLLDYYAARPYGRTDLLVPHPGKAGGGLFLIRTWIATDFIPMVGNYYLTCTPAQQRNPRGITALPGEDGGHLVENGIFDVGYYMAAWYGSSQAFNFARAVILLPIDSPRVNLYLDYTPQGHPILRPKHRLIGTQDTPLPLYLGCDSVYIDPTVDTAAQSTVHPVSHKFQPSGRRRDPPPFVAPSTVLPREDQPTEPPSTDSYAAYLEESTTFGSGPCDLVTGCLNVQGKGLFEPLLLAILAFMQRHHITIMGLVDLGSTDGTVLRHVFSAIFGTFHVAIMPAKAPRLQLKRQTTAVGGMAIILDTAKARLERHIRDPSSLGVIHTTKLVVHSRLITIVFTYWPAASPLPAGMALGASDALHSKLLDYLTQRVDPTPLTVTPLEWLQTTITHRRGSQVTDRPFILCGDFNTGFRLTDSSPRSLARLMASLGLTTVLSQVLAARDIHCHSFFRGTQATTIDDMGTNTTDATISTGGRGHASTWHGLCDHVPSFLGHSFGPGNRQHLPPTQPLVSPAKIHLDVTKPQTKALIIQTLQAWWNDYWQIPPGYSPAPNSPDATPPLPSTLEMAGAVTERISRDLANTVLSALGKKPRTTRTGRLPDRYHMSPRLIALRVHRQCLHSIVGTLTPATALGQALRSCRTHIRQWQNHIRKQRVANTYAYEPTVDGRTDAEGWLQLFDHALADSRTFADERHQQANLLTLVSIELSELNKLSNVRQRRKLKDIIGSKSTTREQDALNRRLKKVISSITEKPSTVYNFNELTLPDGSSITDPQQIHQEITTFFTKLFQNPPKALPTILHLEDSTDGADNPWQRMLADPAFFRETFSASNIPPDVINTLAEAFCDPVRTQVAAAAIAKRFEAPLTFADFKRMLMRSRGNSAGGLTGLTYGVLKLAPEGLLLHLFQLLLYMWQHHYVPSYWKDKYLHLMVKDPSLTGLDNLRPIGLIEVLRKLWSNLVIHRIRCGLMDSDFLAENQYGFLPKKGTTDELIQLVNVIEAAAELETPIDISTWDISKAFDSAGRNLQLVLWLRMGVPLAIAQWFIRLDSGGHFIVRSPWAEDQIHRHQHRIPSGTPPPPFASLISRIGFQSHRGFTQGDVLSTTGWVGLFDILLRALDKAPQPGPFYYHGEGIQLHRQKPMAYADDLVTIASNREQTHAYSRIICGFMAAFGLALAPKKIRTTTSIQPPGEIKHYDWDWVEHSLPFGDADHAIPILGIHITASCDWHPLYYRLITHCTKIAQTAGSKMASLSTKAKVLVSSAVAQVLYRTEHASLVAAQKQHLTQILLRVLRDFKPIGPHFPTDAMLSAHLGGAFTDIGTFTELRKWNIQGRMEAIGGPQNQAMHGLLARLHRHRYSDRSPSGQSAIAPLPLNGTLPRWANDLPNSQDPSDCTSYFGSHTTPTIDDLFPGHSQGEILELLNIRYLRELRSISGVPSWLDQARMPRYGDLLAALLRSDIATQAPTSPAMTQALTSTHCMLARDQLYRLPDSAHGSLYFEVDGLLPTGDLAGRWWRSRGRSPLLQPLEPSIRFGGAHSHMWNLATIPLHQSQRTLAYRHHSSEAPRLLGTHSDLTGCLPPPLTLSPAAWCTPVLAHLGPLVSSIRGLVSDASFIAGRPGLHTLFTSAHTPPSWGGGAIVLMGAPASPPLMGILITGLADIPYYNPFVGELLTGLGMAQLRAQLPGCLPAWMDCNSVLLKAGDTLPQSSTQYTNLQDDFGSILSQLRTLRKGTSHPPTRWTQGHPDAAKRQRNGSIRPAIPRTQWGTKEFGIYIADLLASPSPAARTRLRAEGLHPHTIIEIPVWDLLDAVPSPGQWYRCARATPHRPHLQPPRDSSDRSRLAAYLAARDRSSSRPPLWTSVQLGFLLPTLTALNATFLVSRWASFMRYILDRVPHARNKRKWTPDDTEMDLTCPLCADLDITGPHPDDLEHLLTCEHPVLGESRVTFHATLITTLHDWHMARNDAYATYSLTQRYIRICFAPPSSLSRRDRLSGWLARPTPAFLYHFAPNLILSSRVAREFTRALPHLLKHTILWVQSAWLLRCRLLHSDDVTGDSWSQGDTPTPPVASTPPIPSDSLLSYGFTGSHSRVRTLPHNPRQPSPKWLPTTIRHYLSASQPVSLSPYGSLPCLPSDEALSLHSDSSASIPPSPRAYPSHGQARPKLTLPRILFTGASNPSLYTGPWAPSPPPLPRISPRAYSVSSSVTSGDQHGSDVISTDVSLTPGATQGLHCLASVNLPTHTSSPILPSSPMPLRRSKRSRNLCLADRAECLLYDLSREIHTSTLRFQHMLPSSAWLEFRGPSVPSHPRYQAPLPTQLFRGPSLLLGSGQGIFLLDSNRSPPAGTVVGAYWGDDTVNGGIHPSHLPLSAPPPPNARANGAYLLRHGDYLVDCDPDCAVGYLNDPFQVANCFFQPDPENPRRLLVVLRVGLQQGHLHELYVNYGADYWWEHYHLLSPTSRRACEAFYNIDFDLPPPSHSQRSSSGN